MGRSDSTELHKSLHNLQRNYKKNPSEGKKNSVKLSAMHSKKTVVWQGFARGMNLFISAGYIMLLLECIRV